MRWFFAISLIVMLSASAVFACSMGQPIPPDNIRLLEDKSRDTLTEQDKATLSDYRKDMGYIHNVRINSRVVCVILTEEERKERADSRMIDTCATPDCGNWSPERLAEAPYIEGNLRYRKSAEERKAMAVEVAAIAKKWGMK